MTDELRAERMLKRYYPNGFHADRWHFVDEELPTEWGFYLVAIEYGLNGERCVDVGEYSASENRWTVHGEREHHVVAWMRMPNPPKKEE